MDRRPGPGLAATIGDFRPMDSRAPCPLPAQLERFAARTLPPGEHGALEEHISSCPNCLAVVLELEYEQDPDNSGNPALAGERLPPRGAIGPYDLLREIGRGGQGRVYLARDTRLGRHVALKVLPAPVTLVPELRLRFEREAEVLSRLDHPGLCTVYEAVSEEGLAYIAMRYVEGRTLAQIIASDIARSAALELPGRPGIEERASWIERAARALHVAHEMGLVHRDIKPGNLMISTAGEPVLLDFGLVHDDGGGSHSLTRTGELLGTPAYMSPEQVGGDVRRPIDRRSDVYSLGATLFEAVTLRLPFEAPTVPELVQRIARESPPRATRLNPGIPRDLSVILETALEKDPGRRYQTALELAEDLRRWRSREPIRARPAGALLKLVRWGERNRVVALSLGAVFSILAIALGVSLYFLAELRRESAARELALEALELESAEGAFLNGQAGAGVRTLALAARKHPGNSVANIRLASALEHRSFPAVVAPPLRQPGAAVDLQWSVDGRRILTLSAEGGARLWDAATGREVASRRRPSAPFTRGVLASDGQTLALGAQDGSVELLDLSLPGGRPRAELRHTGPVRALCFSADGRALATASEDHTARVWNVATAEPIAGPFEHTEPVTWVSFAPGGKRLVTASADGTARFWSLDLPGSFPLILRSWDSWPITSVSVRPDGAQLAMTDSKGGLRVFETVTGRSVRDSRQGEEPSTCVAFSPDGLLLAVASTFNRIVVLETREYTPTLQIPLAHDGTIRRLELSPEGSRLLSASEDGSARLWSLVTGRPILEPLRHPGPVMLAAFSPGGELAATASFDGSTRLWDLVPRSVRPLVLEQVAPVSAACFSASGRVLATASLDRTVCLWDAASGKLLLPPLEHTDGVTALALAADGQLLAAGAWDGSVRLWDLRAGAPRGRSHQIQGPVIALDLDLARGVIVASSSDAAPVAWRIETGERTLPHLEVPLPLRALRRSSAPAVLVSAGASGLLRGHSGEDGRTLWEVAAHSGEILCLDVSATVPLAVSGGKDNLSHVLEIATGRLVATGPRHGSWVRSIALSPDGSRVATGSSDRTARIWSTSSGTPVSSALKHQGEVSSVAWSPDGSRLATLCADGAWRVWDAATGLALSEPVPGPENPTCLAVSFEGQRLAVGSPSGSTILWDLGFLFASPSPAQIEAALRLVDPSSDMSSAPPRAPGREREVTSRLSAREAAAELERRPGSPRWLAEWARVLLGPKARPDLPGAAGVRLELAERAGSSDPHVRLGRAELLVRAGAVDEAVRLLSPVPEPGAVEPRWWLDRAQLLKRSLPPDAALPALDQAVRAAELALQRGAAGASSRVLKGAHFERSEIHRALGREREAVQDFFAAFDLPARDATASRAQLNLETRFNGALTEGLHGVPGNDLAGVPRGLVELAGVKFDVRGLIQLASATQLVGEFPREVRGIPAGCSGKTLHALLSGGWGAPAGDLTAQIVLHYEDGETRELDVRWGTGIEAFWHVTSPALTPGGSLAVAWVGSNRVSRVQGRRTVLYRASWANPRPAVPVATVDLVSLGKTGAPFFLALTLE